MIGRAKRFPRRRYLDADSFLFLSNYKVHGFRSCHLVVSSFLVEFFGPFLQFLLAGRLS